MGGGQRKLFCFWPLAHEWGKVNLSTNVSLWVPKPQKKTLFKLLLEPKNLDVVWGLAEKMLSFLYLFSRQSLLLQQGLQNFLKESTKDCTAAFQQEKISLPGLYVYSTQEYWTVSKPFC